MDISDENQKRHEFQSILCSLAESQFKTASKKEKADMYKRLEKLYRPSKEAKPYRHFYADIFNVFIKFEDGKHGSAEAVCLNLECIRQGYQAKNVDENNEIIDISESLKKLYDHASLEMARISYTNGEKRTVQSCKEALNELSNNLNHSNTELQNMAQSIRSSQKDYITILGIFAAVVMVFFSGVGFSSSVLANIHQASIYRIWIGITLLGAVLFNSLWVLFNFLREVIDKRQERWKIFKVANSLLAVSIISALICAHYGWFETI